MVASSRAARMGPRAASGQAPLGMLAPTFAPVAKEGDRRHQSGHVIYEMHVRGFTYRAESGVAADKRGTFSGVIEKIPSGARHHEALPVQAGQSAGRATD